MLKRSEKEDVVQELGELFDNSQSIFVTDYLGLTVEQMTDLRKKLRDNEIKYRVAKNTLLRIVAKQKGYEKLVDFFTGPTAIAFGTEDPTVPAKTLYDFKKDIAKDVGKPEVKAFFADGVIYDADKLKELAELPSKEELIAKVVGSIGAPLSNLVGTLDGLLRELCVTIDQIAQQKES
ncbi:MAG: 50S ribosomal protein L10 [candidate division Zixibacteria bacterium]|jgi:large subunit ribosomal protein L10|nr:50S ribosomal protein L10 [candidate division Zixibacteria bacterium]